MNEDAVVPVELCQRPPVESDFDLSPWLHPIPIQLESHQLRAVGVAYVQRVWDLKQLLLGQHRRTAVYWTNVEEWGCKGNHGQEPPKGQGKRSMPPLWG